MEDMDIEDADDDQDDDALIFTPELAMLKAKEKGEEYTGGQPDEDDEMDEADSDDGDNKDQNQ